MNNKIPKIIHQIWWQGQDKVPDKYLKAQLSWKKKHPEWKYKLWTLNDMRNLIKNNYSWFLVYYDNYKYDIQRCDAVRYFFLYHYGGLYVDMDIGCKKNINRILYTLNSELLFLLSGNVNMISNFFIASSRKNKFWVYLWNELIKNYNYNNIKSKHFIVLNTTGPTLLDNTIKLYKPNYKLFPQTLFGGCSICDLKPCSCKQCYLIYYEGGNWNGLDSIIINKIYCKRYFIILFTLIFILTLFIFKNNKIYK